MTAHEIGAHKAQAAWFCVVADCNAKALRLHAQAFMHHCIPCKRHNMLNIITFLKATMMLFATGRPCAVTDWTHGYAHETAASIINSHDYYNPH